LLSELRARSPRFVQLWDEARVSERRSDRKSVDHPALGRITLDCDVLQIPDTDQTLVVYSAAGGTPEAEALGLVRVLGTQDMTPAL
jgi:hypothetical protein